MSLWVVIWWDGDFRHDVATKSGRDGVIGCNSHKGHRGQTNNEYFFQLSNIFLQSTAEEDKTCKYMYDHRTQKYAALIQSIEIVIMMLKLTSKMIITYVQSFNSDDG